MSDLTSIIADQNQQIDAENHENSSKSEELLKVILLKHQLVNEQWKMVLLFCLMELW